MKYRKRSKSIRFRIFINLIMVLILIIRGGNAYHAMSAGIVDGAAEEMLLNDTSKLDMSDKYNIKNDNDIRNEQYIEDESQTERTEAESSESETLPEQTDDESSKNETLPEFMDEEASENETSPEFAEEETSEDENLPEDTEEETSEDENSPEDTEEETSENETLPESTEDESGKNVLPREYLKGEITINNVIYRCDENGEATIINGQNYEGDFLVPNEIIGLGGETYVVTGIMGYQPSDRIYKGAFEGTNITGLYFEEGSQLRNIGNYAFSACYGLAGTSIQIPETVRFIGNEAFYLFFNETGIAELRQPHLLQLNGKLPEIESGKPLEIPEGALQYESAVNSSIEHDVLHKSAKWTNESLTEAEIRIDYGSSRREHKIDFVFVIDYSNSMLSATIATGQNGSNYIYPRSLITNDIIYSVSNIILDSGISGYDNRIGMVAFGTSDTPLWTSDFTNDPVEIDETLSKNPLSLTNRTNYSSGLQGAIDLINNRTDKSRSPFIIFLSDGDPNSGYGTKEAQTLRDMGVKVFPLAIYTEPNSYLTDISYDKKTAYNAGDTDAFERIIMEVVEDIIELDFPLNVTLEDVMSSYFTLATGTSADIEVSSGGGSVELKGERLIWDLKNALPNQVHNIKIAVRLRRDSELTASGDLPTNESMGLTNGSVVSSVQPRLNRYLAYHAFENGTNPEQPLPDEVLAILPNTLGGYRDKSEVRPTELPVNEINLSNGDKWIFMGWDSDSALIDRADVTFHGTWRLFTHYKDLSFIKISKLHNQIADIALDGAAFELYLWTGDKKPLETDIVTIDTIKQGLWNLVGSDTSNNGGHVTFHIPVGNDEIYQLVEKQAPDGYHLPSGQWRITDNMSSSEPFIILPIVGLDGYSPPPFEIKEEGIYANQLTLVNVPVYELPMTGGRGRRSYKKEGIALILCGIFIESLYFHYRKINK